MNFAVYQDYFMVCYKRNDRHSATVSVSGKYFFNLFQLHT